MVQQSNFIAANVWVIASMQQLQEVTTMGLPIVNISETADPYLANNPSIIPAPVLLPQYDAVSKFIDGDEMTAMVMYYNYLSGTIAQDYIQVILTAAILNVRPMYIKFDNDEMAMHFATMFMNFLKDVYGFFLSIDPSKPSVFIRDARYNNLITLLYINGYLKDSGDVLFRLIGSPDTDMINPVLIERLAKDLNPMVVSHDYDNYVVYFKNLMNQMREAGKPLYDPMEGI